MSSETPKNQRNNQSKIRTVSQLLEDPSLDEQIEVYTKAGYRIIIGHTTSGLDKIVITNNNKNKESKEILMRLVI